MKLMHSAIVAAPLLTAPILPGADTLDLKALTTQAEGGDAAAQVALAIRYRDGKGAAKDDALALQEIAFGYFKTAAEKSAQAAINLGQCYFGAQGTEQDIPEGA